MTSSAEAITGLVRQTAAEQAAKRTASGEHYITSDLTAEGSPLRPEHVLKADLTGSATRTLRITELRAAVLKSIARDIQMAPVHSGWARDLGALRTLVLDSDVAVLVVAQSRGLGL